MKKNNPTPWVVVCLMVLLIQCKPDHQDQTILASETNLGEVQWRLKEASGLVASANNPGYLWTLNDSGNPAEIFLIDLHGKIQMVCSLPQAYNRDWEDIALDTTPDGKSYLYIADIGDNSRRYEYKIIYRFAEPLLGKEREHVITEFETFFFRIPEGRQDAEAIMIDPNTHDLFLISKNDNFADIYRAPHVLTKDTMELEKIMTLPFGQVVAGSISADGRKVLLKNYAKIRYWERTSTESVLQLLAQEPEELPYNPEMQGEAITWSRSGKEFYTLSESQWGTPASLMLHTFED